MAIEFNDNKFHIYNDEMSYVIEVSKQRDLLNLYYGTRIDTESVWAPTTYMVLRGLDRCGYSKEAYDIALNTLENVVKVFVETGTFGEDYAPEKAAKGNLAKDNFVGWTGLVPISILIEYVFGIRCNALEKTIEWNTYLDGEYGIDDLTFGEANVSLKHNADGTVDIKTVKPITVTLIQNGVTEIRNCVPNI